MFNVTVIKLRDILKYLIILSIIFIIIFMVKRYFFNKINQNEITQEKTQDESSILKFDFKKMLNIGIPVLASKNENVQELIDENAENADEEFFTKLIGLEIGAINYKVKEEIAENTVNETSQIDDNNSEDQNNTEDLNLAETGLSTEDVTQNPIKESYTDTVNGVKIKNETDFELTDDITNYDNLDIDTTNVIIFHTHTCESYTSSEKYTYTATGNFRTTDLNYSVAKVGDELANYLTKYNFNVIHDKTYHDYPSYTGSYTRSLATVSNILKDTSADIIIDLHRDAIGSNSAYDPTVKIGDDYCAQIMFVMGTNGGGLSHSNWESNLQFAIKVQEKANELYPGLFKPIILRNSRYNQHLGKAACIIEVGATGNTMEQCLNSMKYLSEVMNSCLK